MKINDQIFYVFRLPLATVSGLQLGVTVVTEGWSDTLNAWPELNVLKQTANHVILPPNSNNNRVAAVIGWLHHVTLVESDTWSKDTWRKILFSPFHQITIIWYTISPNNNNMIHFHSSVHHLLCPYLLKSNWAFQCLTIFYFFLFAVVFHVNICKVVLCNSRYNLYVNFKNMVEYKCR